MKAWLLFLSAVVYCSAVISAQVKYEPPSGCYSGAFIVYDPKAAGSVPVFEQLTGKKHAIYFNYSGYGSPFPSSWAGDYAKRGAAVQIAFEPNGGLNEVTDGDYIREWAREAHKTGAVIFLRWACEMNGSWVAWYGNPKLYIEKFRLIHDIMKEEAPNVAMVWAPNNIPNNPLNAPDDINAYYPGDEYVDWVGIDFYCVYVSENGTPEREDPREKLKVVYNTYAAKKPVMICEWAAASYSYRTIPAQSVTQYANAMMDSLYLNAQKQFPKLKAVNWFSMNSQTSNKCDFSLTNNQAVLDNYRKDIQPEYFLSSPYRNVPLVEFQNINQDSAYAEDFSFSVKITCELKPDSVVFYIGGNRISGINAEPYNFYFPAKNLDDGVYTVKVFAYTGKGLWNFGDVNVILDKNRRYMNSIIDDGSPQVSYTGYWTFSNSQPDRYGSGYRYYAAGDGSAKAVWHPAFNSAGCYNVYAWWPAHENRASNAPYIVSHKYGADTIKVNQKINGGKWNYLGRYYFEQGNSGALTLTNNADGIVIADAARFEWAFPEAVQDFRTPKNFRLMQNYPNPFNPATVISFSIREKAHVQLRVYDALGRLVATLIDEEKEPGVYNAQFNAVKGKSSSLSSGVYYYSLRAGGYFETKKMIIQK
jgi:hypothetical protein